MHVQKEVKCLDIGHSVRGSEALQAKHLFLHTIDKIIRSSQDTPAYGRLPVCPKATAARIERTMEVHNYPKYIHVPGYKLYFHSLFPEMAISYSFTVVYLREYMMLRKKKMLTMFFGEKGRLITPLAKISTKC